MAFAGNIIARVGADINPLQNGLRNAQNSLNSFRNRSNSSLRQFENSIRRVNPALSGVQNNIKSFSAISGSAIATFSGIAVTAMAAATTAFAMLSKSATSEAIEYESALQRVSFMFGKNAKDMVNWSNTQASAFNMSKLEAVKYSAIYGNLIMTFAKDTQQLTDYTTNLLKASAIVASSTGRNMQDVMERIRSGLLGNTEAIEDLGVSIFVNMIESTAAFKKFANGKSWDQLNFQTQQQIRLFAILEQVTQKFGDSLYVNTASSLAKLTTNLQNIKLNIGLAFMPIVNVVLPVITRLASMLEYVTGVISKFMFALFGYNLAQAQSAQSAANSQKKLGEETKKAGNKAKNALASFDEINQLQEDLAGNADDAAGAVGSSGVDTSGLLGDGAGMQTPAWIKNLANDVRNYLAPLEEPFNKVKAAISNFGIALQEIKGNENFQKALKAIGNFFLTFQVDLWSGYLRTLAGAFETLTGAVTILDGVLSGDFTKTMRGTKLLIQGFYDMLLGILPIPESWRTSIDNIVKDTGKGLTTLYNDIKKYGDPAKFEFSDIFMYMKDKASNAWILIKSNTFEQLVKLYNIITITWEDIKKIASTKWEEIKTVINTIWGLIVNGDWDGIYNALIASWDSLQEQTAIKWESFKQALKLVWDGFLTFIKWDAIKTAILGYWDSLKTESETKFTTFKDALSKKWNEIKGLTWSSVKDAIITTWTELESRTGEIFTGIATTITTQINNVISKINSFIKTINSTKISIPAVNIPGIGTIGGGSVGFPQIPEIPKLASGGIITSPTLATIGEAGTEAVIPLNNNGGFVDTLAGAIGSAVLSAMQFSQGNNSNSGNREVIIKVDSTQLARAIIPAIDRENQRTGNYAIIQGI